MRHNETKGGKNFNGVTIIPSDWEIVPFGSIVESTQLGVDVRATRDGEGLPLIKMGNMTRGGLNLSKVEHIESLDETQFRDYILRNNDFLFNTRNSVNLVGKTAIWSETEDTFLFNSNIMRIYFKKNMVSDPQFICYFLSSDLGWRISRRMVNRTTSVAAIYWKDLSNISIPLPSLSEQSQIVAIIENVDKTLRLTSEAIASIKILKKGLMQRLLTRGIGHTRFKQTKIGEIPKSWDVERLSNVARNRTERYTPRGDEHLPYVGLEHIITSQSWIDKNGTSSETRSQKTVFNRGEVLFGKLRPYLRKIAAPSFDGVCSTDILVFTSKKNLINEYLLLLLSSNRAIQYAIKTSEGTKMPRTSWNSMKLLEFPIPPVDEQKRIVGVISTITKAMKIEKQEEHNFQQLKKGLMQVLLTGKVRVTI